MASPCPLHPTAPAAERSSRARDRSASRSTIGRVRMPGLVGLLLLSTALADGAALASSPDAWRAYDRQVRTACVAASRLAAAGEGQAGGRTRPGYQRPAAGGHLSPAPHAWPKRIGAVPV